MDTQVSRFEPIIRELMVWVVAAVLLWGGDYLKVTGFLKNPLESSLWSLHYHVGEGLHTLKAPLRTLDFWRQGSARLTDLEARLVLMAVDRQELEAIEAENLRLKEALLVKPEASLPALATGLLTDSGGKMRLNLGEREGIKEGMILTDAAGILVGKVSSVGRYTSLVELPSDRDVRIPVRLIGKSTQGILTGDGLGINLTEVLQAESLNVGDIIVTAGGEGDYPEGLVIGQVTELTGKAAEITKGAQIKPLSDLKGAVFIR